MIARLCRGVAVLALVTPAYGQGAAQQTPAQDPAKPVVYEEQVIVSASRAEQQLVNAPAAVSIVSAETIQNSPATNVGDLLRTVPGLNVSQTSARDINLTTRGATSTLSTSQLALIDGRPIYLDFFGMVMWDLMPASSTEIKQIEVIRGPASAVWGANAMSGVVNVITMSPRELAARNGTSVTIGAGVFGRSAQDVDRSSGSLFYVNGSHAEAVNERVAFKLSAGYLTQDPLARPVGSIPNAFNTAYPTYTNQGTSQPKFDARVDIGLRDTGSLILSGGVAGTEGAIHSGLGPFDVDKSSRLAYLSARYQKGARRIAFFTNLLNGDASNLLSRGATGEFLPLSFDTRTFDVEASDVRPIGRRHVLTFGGNFRHNSFDISLAPNGDNRSEGGGYVQDEIFLGERVRLVVGSRLDKFSSVNDVVASPRMAVLFKPSPSQTVRVSFNRAFRAPSYINNHIDTTVLNEVNLSAISPALSRFVFPLRAVGNPDLREEALTAWELGYTGVVRNRATVTAAVYWNTTKDAIFFTQAGRYTATNPPATWPSVIPTFVLNLIPAPGLPSSFTYRNLGTVKDKGLELGVDGAIDATWSLFGNYSFQADPEIEGFDPSEANVPASHRFNVGLNGSTSRWLGNVSLSYTSEAYWQDVLDVRFAGVTDAFTLVNAGVGLKWADEKVVTSLKVTNLFDREVQQHIFGDIIKRQVVGEVRFSF
jgi:outer membrane receptor protein involved in Fe transport